MELLKKLKSDKILSCLIYQNNEPIFKYYSHSKVEKNLQVINSCTKSFMSALIGIAIDKQYIESIDTPIVTYFKDVCNEDSRIYDVTIRHLLTMTPGFDWPEFGEWNNFAPMVYSNHIIEFILSRPFTHNPGEVMNYNSGCSHLLSAILMKVTGMKTSEFAGTFLLKPLGIEDYKWYEKQGVSLGADGLRILSADMAKFGLLYLNNGVYQNKQLISSHWIKESTQPLYSTYKNIADYGYHFWVSSYQGVSFYFALGYGGQYIIIVPERNLVVVMTSRMYKHSLKPLHIFKKIILNMTS